MVSILSFREIIKISAKLIVKVIVASREKVGVVTKVDVLTVVVFDLTISDSWRVSWPRFVGKDDVRIVL